MDLFANYSSEMLMRDLIQVITFAGMVYGLVKSIRSAPQEQKKAKNENIQQEIGIKSSLMKTLEDSTERAVNRAFDFEQKMIEQDAKIENLQGRIVDLECENLKKDAIIESLQDWSERLVHQIQSLDQEPVKMRPVRKVDCSQNKK